MNTNPLDKAISIIGGLSATGRICDVSYKAVSKWLDMGLPRTEWTGETHYAEIISKACKYEVTQDELLIWSLEMHRQRKQPKPPPDRRSGQDRRQSANRRAEESPGRRQGDDRRAAERRQGENCREETDAA